MDKEQIHELSKKAVSILASAGLALILAMLQGILAQHGVDCGPTASPGVAVVSGGAIRVALMAISSAARG